MDRPPVSVVLPFHGSPEDARETLDALARLRLRPDDEVVVVDNTGRGVVPAGDGVTVVDAPREPSSYYARNEGAAAARHEWLLFLDADCVPSPDLADRYFGAGVPDGQCGAVVGEVEGVPDQPSLVAQYARSRGHLGQRMHFESAFRPWGVTANLLVRKSAWASIGGFQEGVRSGGDTEFSWRLQDAGWTLTYRPEAVVAHAHRESVKALARQAARYAAGRRWVMSRYPGSFVRPTIARDLVRCAAGIVVWAVALQPRRALFKALDAVYVGARWPAFFLSNTPPGRPTRSPPAPWSWWPWHSPTRPSPPTSPRPTGRRPAHRSTPRVARSAWIVSRPGVWSWRTPRTTGSRAVRVRSSPSFVVGRWHWPEHGGRGGGCPGGSRPSRRGRSAWVPQVRRSSCPHRHRRSRRRPCSPI